MRSADPEPTTGADTPGNRYHPLLTVWVSADGHDDLDLYVYVRNLDRRGRQLWHQTAELGLPGGRRWMPLLHRLGVRQVGSAFYGGSDGVVRVSGRGLDHTALPAFPVLELRRERSVPPGAVVEAEVPLWPVAVRWHATGQCGARQVSAGLRWVLPAGALYPWSCL